MPRGNTFGFVTDLAHRADTNFLFGTLDYDFGADGHAQADYNAAMLVTPGSSVQSHTGARFTYSSPSRRM